MATTEKIHTGYVITESGLVLLQIPDDNQWGFYLADDDQSWAGGFDIASSWEALSDADPRITEEDRERLGGILDAIRDGLV